ncbi:hypothetical protein AA313_de0205518 [Arthrobotrys entomopaga]|nr:hypothetical protein AA313_de0205518 [Arthrobotrys entomopaga]
MGPPNAPRYPIIPYINDYQHKNPKDLANQDIHATGGGFWIGKKTAAICPLDKKKCPKTTGVTAFTVWHASTISLDTQVPGGQQVYVTAEGVLTYTKPHSAAIPKGSLTKGFDIASGAPGFFVTAPGQWKACPIKKGKAPYQVFLEPFQKKLQNKDVPSKNAKDCMNIFVGYRGASTKFGTSAYEYA